VHLSPLGFAACQSKKCTNKTETKGGTCLKCTNLIECTDKTLVHLRQVHPI
jgi:hypothetical protein